MAHERDFDRVIGGKTHARADERIARVAEGQYGVVTRAQLTCLGLGPDAIDHRLRLRRLIALHRGVYAVGQRRLPKEARWTAAVLAYGPGAVLSNRSGAAHWQIARHHGACEVTIAAARRSRPGIRVHRVRLAADEVTVHEGIRITTVPRTLFDLAASLSVRQLERAINEAEVLRLWDELSLDDLLRRYPRRRGNATVRAALAGRRAGATATKSELEEMFLSLIDRAGLPRPLVNMIVEGYEVDVLWPEHGLVVELDGRAVHGTVMAFEADRERDRVLHVAGWRPVRITHRQMSDRPERVIADVRALLGGRLAA